MQTEAPAPPVTLAEPTTRSRVPWVFALVVVLVVAAGGVWWALSADDGSPTVTFDGELATYDGPAILDAGEITWTIDASAYEPGAALIVAELRDESLTLADLEQWATENEASVGPPFIGSLWMTLATYGDRIVDEVHRLEPGIYSVWVNTAPNDTDRAYPVAIIEVE